MARNATKAQVRARLHEAGVATPSRKMDSDELRVHLGRRAVAFDAAKGKERRSRSNTKRKAINNGW